VDFLISYSLLIRFLFLGDELSFVVVGILFKSFRADFFGQQPKAMMVLVFVKPVGRVVIFYFSSPGIILGGNNISAIFSFNDISSGIAI